MSSFWLILNQQWTIKISSPLFSIFSLAAILVGSQDHRTQFWKGAIQGPFHQSLVAIGPVFSEEKIKMWNVDGRTDDGRKVMTIAHLKARWAKKYGLEKTDRATKTSLFDRNWATSLKPRWRSRPLHLVWWALHMYGIGNLLTMNSSKHYVSVQIIFSIFNLKIFFIIIFKTTQTTTIGIYPAIGLFLS